MQTINQRSLKEVSGGCLTLKDTDGHIVKLSPAFYKLSCAEVRAFCSDNPSLNRCELVNKIPPRV